MSEVNESTATKAAFHMVMLQNTHKKSCCAVYSRTKKSSALRQQWAAVL